MAHFRFLQCFGLYLQEMGVYEYLYKLTHQCIWYVFSVHCVTSHYRLGGQPYLAVIVDLSCSKNLSGILCKYFIHFKTNKMRDRFDILLTFYMVSYFVRISNGSTWLLSNYFQCCHNIPTKYQNNLQTRTVPRTMPHPWLVCKSVRHLIFVVEMFLMHS